jgi:CheY-like chemotaxis protein
MGIGEVARYLSTGTITLAVEPQSRSARLVISGQPSSDQNPVVSDLLHEMLAASGVAARLAHLADTVTLSVDLPLAGTGKLTVLVVDDNTDLERLYQRFTADTSFRLVLSARGQGVMEMIQTDRPDVIVLDVMLPDIDGWDLLVNLHEHPDTRAIPVVVHSVIREEELALALGAKVYLPKPARRREFIDALERALNRAPAEETTEPANSAAA